jgi:hypothetical protein
MLAKHVVAAHVAVAQCLAYDVAAPSLAAADAATGRGSRGGSLHQADTAGRNDRAARSFCLLSSTMPPVLLSSLPPPPLSNSAR